MVDVDINSVITTSGRGPYGGVGSIAGYGGSYGGSGGISNSSCPMFYSSTPTQVGTCILLI